MNASNTETTSHWLCVKTHTHLNRQHTQSSFLAQRGPIHWVPSPSQCLSPSSFLTPTVKVSPLLLCPACTALHTWAPKALCCCKGMDASAASPQTCSSTWHSKLWPSSLTAGPGDSPGSRTLPHTSDHVPCQHLCPISTGCPGRFLLLLFSTPTMSSTPFSLPNAVPFNTYDDVLQTSGISLTNILSASYYFSLNIYPVST